MTEPGNSKEQQVAEDWLLKRLSSKLRLHLNLVNRRLQFENGGRIELDGFHEKPLVLCEAWAHVGAPKSAQRAKVMADALRLLLAAKHLRKRGRLILLFGDPEAAAHFQGRSWMAHCLKTFSIQVIVLPLPPGLREMVRRAQVRQYR